MSLTTQPHQPQEPPQASQEPPQAPQQSPQAPQEPPQASQEPPQLSQHQEPPQAPQKQPQASQSPQKQPQAPQKQPQAPQKNLRQSVQTKPQLVQKNLEKVMGDLSREQIEGLHDFSQKLKNPNSMSYQQAMSIMKTLNIDMKTLQKNANSAMGGVSQLVRKPKIGVNAPCPCNSGKKYKKCCKHLERLVKNVEQ